MLLQEQIQYLKVRHEVQALLDVILLPEVVEVVVKIQLQELMVDQEEAVVIIVVLVDQVIHPQSVLHKVIMEVLKLIQDVMVAVVVEQQQLELQIQAPMFLLVDQEQIFLLYMEQELEYQV